MNKEDIIRMAKECGNWSGQTVEMNDVGLERFAKLIRAAIEQAQEPETELETYKHLYELRGKALERPCSNCGHQPAKIKAMAQPEHEPVTHTLNCVCGAVWDVSPHGVEEMVHAPTPPPSQWQGLTDEEIENMMDYWSEPVRSAYGGAHTANGEYVCIADIIRDAEKRLKERNT